MGDEMGPGNEEKNDEQFIDRSKVGILLCDNDDKSCDHIFELLSNCSYHEVDHFYVHATSVTTVKSARQVIDALNAEGPNIDIILCEVDLPMRKGFKLLKYLMRDQELQRIPVIMMSTQDEVSLVVKCLRLGAADYLVKPLRRNELLNLWTHMWRRRRMLGLAEKNIVTYDFDLAASDHSDANTNSTTLFSDDTDDNCRKSVNPELSVVGQREDDLLQSDKATSESVMLMDSFDCLPGVPGMSDHRTGQVVLFPRKNELKIGECSAFLTYVKSNTFDSCQSAAAADKNMINNNSCQAVVAVDIEGNAPPPLRVEDKPEKWHEHVSNGYMRHGNRNTLENNSQEEDIPSNITSVPDSTSMERSATPPVSMGFIPNTSSDEGGSQANTKSRNGAHFNHYPYYMSGMMNHMMTSAPVYQKEFQGHGDNLCIIPHYNHLPHCPSHVSGMSPFPYYPPLGMCVQQGQLPSNQQPQSYGELPSSEAGLSKVDRREAALTKFRQKREKRCFDKKVRYVNRKKLAERRPRVRGQFVRKVNGVDVDLNADLDEDDDDDPTSHEDNVP